MPVGSGGGLSGRPHAAPTPFLFLLQKDGISSPRAGLICLQRGLPAPLSLEFRSQLCMQSFTTPHSLFHMCCSTLSFCGRCSQLWSCCAVLWFCFEHPRTVRPAPKLQVDLLLHSCHRRQHCCLGSEDPDIHRATAGATQQACISRR